MAETTAIPAATEPGATEYRALSDHCIHCRRCRRETAIACPEARRLRSAWSAARRAGRGGARCR